MRREGEILCYWLIPEHEAELGFSLAVRRQERDGEGRG